MAKRVRQKFVKSEQLRGKNFKKGSSDSTSASLHEEGGLAIPVVADCLGQTRFSGQSISKA